MRIQMQSRFLRTFLAVAHAQSMTRASETLHLAQSSVSDQIQALESEWGAALFTRTRQGLILTPAGEALKPYAEKILALAGEARAAVDTASGHSRALAIGTLETIAGTLLPGWLNAFGQQDVGTAVNVKVAGSGALLEGVKDGTLDAAICFDKGTFHEPLAKHLIGMADIVHIGPPRAAGPVTPSSDQQLGAHHFFTTERGCVYRHLFDRVLAESAAWKPASVSEVGSFAAIGQLVAAGMGHALVPRLAVSDLLDRGCVAEWPWHAHMPPAPLVLTWRRRRVQPPALKRFLHYASQLGELKPADGLPRRAAPSPS
jgi:DNA-binding transcriptional LysR family regulator